MSTPASTHDGPGRIPDDGAVALDYARRAFERQRVPLPPPGFRVDWDDQPFRHTFYRDAPKLPLPAPFSAPVPGGVLASVERARAARNPAATPTPEELAAALACYAVTGRRASPDWNDDSTRRLHVGQAVWSRPTASGGGMYPVESYLVAGPDTVLPCGVYHHDTAHHALDRLSVQDRTAALEEASGVRAPLYLVATLRFWKNSFKYHSFAYHVVTQDTGALLGSWRTVLAAFGHTPRPVLWFDEAPVSAAVGVDGRTEAPFLVLPLGERTGGPSPRLLPGPAAPLPRVWERSRRVRSFELVEQVHLAALVGDAPRPAPEAGADCVAGPPTGDGPSVPLPPAEDAADGGGLERALRTRRSGFGVLSARPALHPAELGRILRAAERIGRCPTDVAPGPDRRPWVRLRLLANAVDGLERRAYCYDGDSHRLLPGPAVDFSDLQRHYALTNYDLRQCAAVVAVCGRLEPLVGAYGARGYRMLGIEVGQAAQSAYLAAAEADLGIGAVLGLDNPALDAMLGISGTDERSMLFLLLGRRRAPRTGYDHDLYRPRPTSEGAQR
ncbi:nitroreductase family protein [Thermobifida halotolerans]|uniref:Nitroreductase family protein n=1 Tax=Thermobifida halotolerans TaxID=483545 RepID=A0AA97LZ42_9ACTN|nr:nitroreductase family protein [Thermobifida halotolerans]UOE20619.1 nitroreductase family protein [Thermobifida halotolerans]